MTENTMIFVWLGLTIVFAILEGATAQLTTVWFAVGSIAAFILAVCGVKSITVQIIVFVAVSMVAVIATRPLVKKIMHKKIQPTNADRNVGETGIVTSDINNLEGKGEVSVRGTVWTARSIDDAVIPKGTTVRVLKIEGVKLIVENL